MQARRVLLLSAIALSAACSATMLGACGGGDTEYIYVYPDASVVDAKKPTTVDTDSGDDDTIPSCDPVAVPSFTFKSPGKYLGKCTDAQLGELYDKCISDQNSIADCEAAQKTMADCSSCAFGGVADAVEHPWLVYDDGVTAFPNYGLCMATIKDETAATSCSVAYGQFFSCLNAACVTPCAKVQDKDAFDACRAAANEQGLCQAGGATALSTTCKATYAASNSTYGFCTSGKDAQGKDFDDRSYMIAIAGLTCGTNPNPDGGVDGGADADADAGADDAGDAGDADAD